MPKNFAPHLAESIANMRFTSSALDDIERVKIAQENRLRSLTRSEPDEDNIVRGLGLPNDNPNVIIASATVDSLKAVEKELVKDLTKQLKKSPFYAFSKDLRGVGEKQFARLLTSIGDPFWREEDIINVADDPITTRDGRVIEPGEISFPAGSRTISQLWGYAGLANNEDGSIVRRTKGVKSNWNTEAKNRAWLIVESCQKQLDPECKATSETAIKEHYEDCACSPYRVVIDDRRTDTLVTHPEWTPGHSMADAQRIAMRHLLRDMWRFARDVHVANGLVLNVEGLSPDARAEYLKLAA